MRTVDHAHVLICRLGSAKAPLARANVVAFGGSPAFRVPVNIRESLWSSGSWNWGTRGLCFARIGSGFGVRFVVYGETFDVC
jgi:hypothetical protein